MPTQITLNQLLIVGAIAGFVVGLVPLILGFSKQRRALAVFGFILTLIAGMGLSLLGALPVAGLFIWLILRKQSRSQTTGDLAENEKPSSFGIDESPERQ